jgi:hypothetical protein
VYELVNSRSNRQVLKQSLEDGLARESRWVSDARGSIAGRDGPRLYGKSDVPLDFRDGRYPLTLILENDSTAVPAVGRPIESAGWNVVKISRFFNCGSTALASSGCDRMR